MGRPPVRTAPSTTAASRQSEYGPIVVAAAAVVLFGGGALIWFVAHRISTFLATHQTASAALGWLLFALVVGIVLAAFGGLAFLGARAWHHRGLVMPTEDGRVPVHLKTLRTTGADVEQMRNAGRVAFEDSRRLIPQGTHTASISHPGAIVDAEIVDAEIVEPVRDVPPLSALLRDGLIRPGRFCIGFGLDGQPIYGTWEDFCTIGAGGTMGTGKSNDGAFYLAQVLAVGGIGYVADPNAGHSQSLANRLGKMAEMLAAPVAKMPPDILELVQKVRRILAERIATNDEGEVPIILLIDEFTAIMLDDDLAEALPKLLSIINTQGRKYGVFVFLLAQLWGAEMTGGTKVRNLLAGRICHNLPMQEARNLLGLPAAAMPKDIAELQRGECYVRTLTGALHRVTIPLVDAEGVADLRRRVAGSAGGGTFDGPSMDLRSTFAAPVLRAVESISEGGSEGALEKWADALDFTVNHLRALIVARLQEGKTAAQLITLIDERAKGGDRRMLAQRAVAEVMKSEIGKGA